MADASDHALAARVASDTGDMLVALLEDPAANGRGWNSLEYTGDRSAHELLTAEHTRAPPNALGPSDAGRGNHEGA